MTVVSAYGNNFKRYEIVKVIFDKTPQSKFNNQKFSDYIDYYQQQYKKEIKIKN